jgi:phospholipid transport system transporter-binding protein
MLVSGPLTLETAREASRAEIPAGGNVSIVDLSGVTTVDSSALGVLMHWSRQHAGELEFINVPVNLRSLADLYDVSGLLSITASNNASH